MALEVFESVHQDWYCSILKWQSLLREVHWGFRSRRSFVDWSKAWLDEYLFMQTSRDAIFTPAVWSHCSFKWEIKKATQVVHYVT